MKVTDNCVEGNKVNLCMSCRREVGACGASYEDMLFGDGTGNDNICCCSYYTPVKNRLWWGGPIKLPHHEAVVDKAMQEKLYGGRDDHKA